MVCVQTDISSDSRAKQKLRREVERAKRALSSQHQVRCPIDSVTFSGTVLPSFVVKPSAGGISEYLLCVIESNGGQGSSYPVGFGVQPVS